MEKFWLNVIRCLSSWSDSCVNISTRRLFPTERPESMKRKLLNNKCSDLTFRRNSIFLHMNRLKKQNIILVFLLVSSRAAPASPANWNLKIKAFLTTPTGQTRSRTQKQKKSSLNGFAFYFLPTFSFIHRFSSTLFLYVSHGWRLKSNVSC